MNKSTNATSVVSVTPSGTETRLQKYYRERVENLEAERAEIVKAVLDAAPSQEEVHKARWDLITKQDEVEELQLALGKANVYLLDQKKLMLILKSENETLESENQLQSRQIDHLLSLVPVASRDEITFLQDVISLDEQMFHAGKENKQGTNSVPDRSNDRKNKHMQGKATKKSQSLAKNRTATQRVRTGVDESSGKMVNGPHERGVLASHHQQKHSAVLSLQRQLERKQETISRLEEKLRLMEVLAAEQTQVMEQSFAHRSRGTDLRCQELKQAVVKLENQLLESKGKVKDLTIHAIETKKDFDRRERLQISENQTLRNTNQQVVNQLQFERNLRKVNSSSQAGSGNINSYKVPQALRNASERRLPSAKVAFKHARRAQVKLNEKQRENRKLTVAYQEKMRAGTKAVEFWKRKFKRLEVRRNLEFQGWRTDIDFLRQQIQQLEAVWSCQENATSRVAAGKVSVPLFTRPKHNLKSPTVEPRKLNSEIHAIRSHLDKMQSHYSIKSQSQEMDFEDT